MKSTRYLVLMLTFVLGACGTLNNTRIQYHRVADQPAKEQQALEHVNTTAELSTEYTTNFKELDKADEVEENTVSLQEPIAEQPLCDTLVLKSGIKMPAKVVEIGVNTISSRKCDEPEGEIYNISANLVEEIIHSDGTVTTITVVAVEEVPPLPELKMAKMSALFGVLGLIPIIGAIFAMIAIIFGFVALARIKKEPNLYGGRKKAITGIVLGIVTLVLWVALISFAFATCIYCG